MTPTEMATEKVEQAARLLQQLDVLDRADRVVIERLTQRRNAIHHAQRQLRLGAGVDKVRWELKQAGVDLG